MNLEFDFVDGTCGTYMIHNDEKVMLCFGQSPHTRCDW